MNLEIINIFYIVVVGVISVILARGLVSMFCAGNTYHFVIKDLKEHWWPTIALVALPVAAAILYFRH